MIKQISTALLPVVFLLLLIFFFSSNTYPASAQLSGCGEINVGNPGANVSVPPQCQGGGGNGAAKWPFAKKDPSTFRRIDQGWDFQGSSPQIVYAVAAGKVTKANNDPSGFGDFYPYETLDTPVTVQGRKYVSIYYGHTHYADGTHGTPRNVLGTHVNSGDPIAYTYPGCCWPANWLEIGFGDNVPVAHGAAGATIQGLDMEEYLAGTRKVYQ
jgi:hypothetical protein